MKFYSCYANLHLLRVSLNIRKILYGQIQVLRLIDIPLYYIITIEVLTSFAGLMAVKWQSVRKLGYYPPYNEYIRRGLPSIHTTK